MDPIVTIFRTKRLSSAIFALFVFVFISTAQAEGEFSGQWRLDPKRSSAVDPWRSIELQISVEGDQARVTELMTTGRRSAEQAFEIDLSQGANEVPFEWWAGNRHIGAFAGINAVKRISGERLDGGRTLRLESTFDLHTSQSETPAREYSEYRISDDGKTLTRITLRSTRPLPLVHVFDRM